MGLDGSSRCQKDYKTEEEGLKDDLEYILNTYGKFDSCTFSKTDTICLVSSSAMISARWYSRASLSVENWVTRSVRSMIREVKPLASR